MSSKVLTLKYRPGTFAELLVQDHVKRTLTRAIEQKRFANAYLFAGPRGVGKTTTARILAKSLNCLSFKEPTVFPCGKCTACIEIQGSRSMDVLEIDGASNRGIDQVRELRENIKYAPSSLRFKVYIIDEVHMLTEHAFNALLKTLEEPPVHSKFVFATTAAHKVPATIISRCQRFDFRQATPEEIVSRLNWLAEREKIVVSDPALLAIARRADGSIRDAESILEQLGTYKPEGIELADVEELLGLVPADLFFTFVDSLLAADSAGLLRLIGQVVEQGHDLSEFGSGLVEHFRDLLLCRARAAGRDTPRSPDEQTRLSAQADRVGSDRLVKALETMLENEESSRYTKFPRVNLECLVMKLAGLFMDQSSQAATPSVEPRFPNPQPPITDPPPVQDTAPDSDRRTSVVSAETLWQELCVRVRGRKPVLAKYLDTCRLGSYAGDTLTIAGPQKSLDKLGADKNLLEEILLSVLGYETALALTPERNTNSVGLNIESISRVLGEIEPVKRKK